EGLSQKFNGLRAILPQLGVRTVQELAGVEAENLMHRAKSSKTLADTPISNALIGAAVEEARSVMGLTRFSGAKQHALRLAGTASFRRAILPRAAGPAQFATNVPAGSNAELLIQRPSGAERFPVRGSASFTVNVTSEDIASAEPLQVRLTNLS